MFVSTSIPTCIIIFNKKKTSSLVSMIDLREKAEVEVREQRGQFGKQNARVYKKEFNILPEDMAEQVKKMIVEQLNIAGVCRSVTIQDIEDQDFNLSPNRYIESDKQANIHRPLNDIANDLNRIIDLKNSVKITINENMAKSLGIYDLAVDFKKGEEISKTLSDELANIGLKIKKTSSLSLTRNKELKIEVKNFERLPEIISVVMNLWRTQMMFFNNEENRLLAELRDALITELFSGKLPIGKEKE
nr:MAG TPA: N-6 DNA Methylase [Caudoviricetes sp.]